MGKTHNQRHSSFSRLSPFFSQSLFPCLHFWIWLRKAWFAWQKDVYTAQSASNMSFSLFSKSFCLYFYPYLHSLWLPLWGRGRSLSRSTFMNIHQRSMTDNVSWDILGRNGIREISLTPNFFQLQHSSGILITNHNWRVISSCILHLAYSKIPYFPSFSPSPLLSPPLPSPTQHKTWLFHSSPLNFKNVFGPFESKHLN